MSFITFILGAALLNVATAIFLWAMFKPAVGYPISHCFHRKTMWYALDSDHEHRYCLNCGAWESRLVSRTEVD